MTTIFHLFKVKKGWMNMTIFRLVYLKSPKKELCIKIEQNIKILKPKTFGFFLYYMIVYN